MICINNFVPSGDVWPIKCEFTHCRAHADHQTFIGLLRSSTSDPFTWQDPDATSDVSQFWETDPSSSSRLCAKLNYVFIEGSNCQSLSYVCKVAASGKTLHLAGARSSRTRDVTAFIQVACYVCNVSLMTSHIRNFA